MESTRPRRNARKNVLYSNDDFELTSTGIAVTSEQGAVEKKTGEKLADKGPPDLSQVSDQESDEDEEEESPPSLEVHPLAKKRGRKPIVKKFGPKMRPKKSPKKKPATSSERIAPRRVLSAQHNVKLFHQDIELTSDGDAYATVIPGCLTELLRKERLLEILTSPEFDPEWMISKPPRLPPMTSEAGSFAFYVDGTQCKNARDLSFDDLRPWSGDGVKPNVRRHPVALLGGKLMVVRHETRLAHYFLTEYSSRLPREQRLKKKIFYMTRDNKIFGNVLIIYHYEKSGSIPTPIFAPHGNDLLKNVDTKPALGEELDESPFEDQPYEGLRGGIYLKLKPNKLGWAHNKQYLLDCLSNRNMIDQQFMNTQLPDVPPLIQTTGVFVYFVPSEYVANLIVQAKDGLSPWTSDPENAGSDRTTPRVRSTRRALVQEGGVLHMARDAKMLSDFYLVETMSVLARCKRIRKRVFYIQRNQSVTIGTVCYTYEFIDDGPLPEIYTRGHEKLRFAPPSISKREDQKEEDNPKNELDDDHHPIIFDHQEEVIHEEQVMEELDYPDMPPNGFDDEFEDDPMESAINSHPYYDIPRQLSTGHVYLTIRHKKLATTFENVLEWIVNSNEVEQRGILNETKPVHPPMVTNARAYAFFVAATAIFPHAINQDDFSPWSQNRTRENPICYRTKSRKFGVVCDKETSQFRIDTTNPYQKFPFHLVFLYSINPKDPRLKKKIYYMMETQSKMVVSHALIVYDYTMEGAIVKLNTLRSLKVHASETVFLEVEPIPEEARESPFRLPVNVGADGSVYMEVTSLDFWSDRNRHLDYLINQPGLVQCLNQKIPELPPTCSEKGTFVYFINGEEVNPRSLTIDRLGPWSEHASTTSHNMRPKSSKTPLALNSKNQLRVLKSFAGMDPSDYQLHIYTATLPRCQRLRKKIVYVQHQGRLIGNAMVMYSFTEPGLVPEPIGKYSVQSRWHLEEEIVEEEMPTTLMDHEMIVEEEVVIEEVAAVVNAEGRNPVLEKSVTHTGFVRGSQRYEAMWRIAQKQFGANSQDETFDDIFKLLYEKNEERLLTLVNTTFNVDIFEGSRLDDHVDYMDMELEAPVYEVPTKTVVEVVEEDEKVMI